jgi:putative toxin-antitoxin system antitoxin component (TIGR02293 family)
MVSAAEILTLLGQRSTKQANRADRLVREGLPFSVVSKLATTYDVPNKDIERLIGIPSSTSHRRSRLERALKAGHSDRAFRLAKAFVLARHVFRDVEKARRWFGKPNRSLAGESPISLLDTDPGTDRVLRVLLQIEHGIY